MADRSREELVIRALRVLGAVPNGQTPDDEDKDIVDSYWQPLIAKLSAMSITTIDDPSTVPEAQFLDLAIVLAEAALGEFGMAALPPPYDARMAEMNLRTIVSVGATQETVETTNPDTGADVEYEQAATLVGEFF